MIRHSAKVLLVKSLAKFLRFTEISEEVILALSISALWMLLFATIIARELHLSLFFAEELYKFFRILICFAGFSYAVRQARHIRMAAIFELMKQRIKKVLIFIQVFVGAFLSFYMAYLGLSYALEVHRMGHETPCLLIEYWIFLVIIPVGFVFGGIHYLRTAFKNMLEKEVWLSPERQSDYLVE